jgi:hypothetical protein
MIGLQAGDKIVVVERCDDTLPELFLGRVGIVVGPLGYQGVGDDEGDPVFLVRHGPSMGRSTVKQFYWREEISKL